MNRTEQPVRPQTTFRYCACSAFILAALLVAGCGGGSGNGSSPAAINSAPQDSSSLQPATASSAQFTVTTDSYGMQNATYLSATKSSLGLVLRAAIASGMTDPNYRTVARIDIADPEAVTAGTVYSLGGASAGAAAFPGAIYFFNGHQSTLLQTVGGSITFSSIGSGSGDPISGSFSAVIEDGGDTATPKASYTVAGNFSFAADAYGPLPAGRLPVPAAAASLYSAKCASCHALGTLDPTPGVGPELALKGGLLNASFPATSAAHGAVALAESQLSTLKVLLNAN